MSTAPTAPAHPVLHNLGQLLLRYGPLVLQWLISSGIIKLPPGVTLPTLPAPGVQADPAVMAQLNHAVEVDTAALAAHLHDCAELLSTTLGN